MFRVTTVLVPFAVMNSSELNDVVNWCVHVFVNGIGIVILVDDLVVFAAAVVEY